MSSSTHNLSTDPSPDQLKAICVPLLATSRLSSSPTNAQATLLSLTQLEAALSEIPPHVFTPPLANYAFFPLSSLLKPAEDGRPRSDAIIEHVMKALAALIHQWRRCVKGGMQDEVLQQLWILVALQLGGPLDPAAPSSKSAKGKGKMVERTDESKLAMVGVLLALIGPIEGTELPMDDDDDPLGETIDWTADDPMLDERSKSASLPAPSSPPIPILFHTLTTLLDLAATPTSLLQLQLSSLGALELLIKHHLSRHPTADATSPSSPSPLLATALPGVASNLSRIALSMPGSSSAVIPGADRKHSFRVIVAALTLLASLLLATVGDEVTAQLRADANEQPGLPHNTLQEIIEGFRAKTNDEDSHVSVAVVNNEKTQQGSSQPPPPAGPTVPTAAWLKYTLDSVSALLASFSPLASHDSPPVRIALVDLLSKITRCCRRGMSERLSGPYEALLVLCGDDWDQVRRPAYAALQEALSIHETDPSAGKIIAEIARVKITALPLQLRKKDERAVERSSKAIRTALDLLATSDSTSFGALGSIDRWSWNMLGALAFSRVSSTRGDQQQGMSLAWITGAASLEDGQLGSRDWPLLPLRNAQDSTTLRDLEQTWRTLGRFSVASGGEAAVVEHFLDSALGPRRWSSTGASSLWVLNGVVAGLGELGRKEKRKVINTVVQGVLSLLDDLDQHDVDEASEAPRGSQAENKVTDNANGDDTSAVIIEHQRGVSHTAGLDALQPVASTESRQDARASQRVLLMSLSLRLLATSAEILAADFQPHLLQTLYHVLTGLSPYSHPIIMCHARQALSLIADSTSYASPQNLVLANVDYVVNAVSQRLSVARLDPAAPLVLVEMIRLVGAPILPMVQDLVEDVFEALDDYHGYEQVTVGLWAVLDALVRVMAEDDETTADSGQTSSPHLGPPTAQPDPEKDWSTFVEWYKQRGKEQGDEGEAEDTLPTENPRAPFGTGSKAEGEPGQEEDEQANGGFPETEPEVPATRPQVVATQILAKALYFLSHNSPFLRSKVLSLMSSAVPILSTRPGDLLPVIHRAWPFILNRLSDPEPYIVLAAADLLEALATHCGTFMSRRILDDVWPKVSTLIERQTQLDRQSALVKAFSNNTSSNSNSNSSGGGSGVGSRQSSSSMTSRYTVSHRLYRALLVTMRAVSSHVPLKDEVAWDQALLFRRFLDDRFDPALQRAAIDMYRALASVNPDTVWLVLSGAVGAVSEEGSLPVGLRIDGQALTANVDLILAEIR